MRIGCSQAQRRGIDGGAGRPTFVDLTLDTQFSSPGSETDGPVSFSRPD